MTNDITSLRQREKFRAILRERGISLRRMSIDLGLNESYFQQFVTYGRPTLIEGNILANVAEYLGIKEELLAPANPAQDEPSNQHTPRLYNSTSSKSHNNSLVVLPCYDLSQKIDAENWRDEKHHASHMAFSRQLLQHITTSSPEQLALLLVHSDAMAPTITHGDIALLDCSQNLASEDGVYALLHESRLLIKRLTIDPIRKQVTLSRDNASYPAIREYSLVDIRVAGRVIWVGKHL